MDPVARYREYLRTNSFYPLVSPHSSPQPAFWKWKAHPTKDLPVLSELVSQDVTKSRREETTRSDSNELYWPIESVYF